MRMHANGPHFSCSYPEFQGGQIEHRILGITSVKTINNLSKGWRKVTLGILAVAIPLLIAAQDGSDEFILGRVAERLTSYPEMQNFEVNVISLIKEMDKNWKPNKETKVEKWVRMHNGVRQEEILRAWETNKGRSSDVTAKMAEETRKQEEKAQTRREKGEPKAEGRRQSLSIEDMFPFSENKQKLYTFTRHSDSYVGRKSVYVIEARAKTRSKEFVEGMFSIDKRSFDVLQAKVHFAKNPTAVKRFEMEARFRVLEQGFLVLQWSRVRIHVGLIVKNIRIEAEEEYLDYTIQDDI